MRIGIPFLSCGCVWEFLRSRSPLHYTKVRVHSRYPKNFRKWIQGKELSSSHKQKEERKRGGGREKEEREEGRGREAGSKDGRQLTIWKPKGSVGPLAPPSGPLIFMGCSGYVKEPDVTTSPCGYPYSKGWLRGCVTCAVTQGLTLRKATYWLNALLSPTCHS